MRKDRRRQKGQGAIDGWVTYDSRAVALYVSHRLAAWMFTGWGSRGDRDGGEGMMMLYDAVLF